jgi:chromosome segregation ATPase
MATITDSTAVEPAFVVERFAVVGDRVEVAGHWRDVRGRRFVRPVLWLHRGEGRRRLVAVLDHKPWAADDGEPWLAAFKWEGGKLAADKAELEVGRELVVELPLPGDRAPKRRPAKARPPSELDRVREQLLSATKERTALQAALDEATVNADEVTRLRAERDHAREEAERARADGERLVNDEYRQRERALQAAEAATVRARESEAARGLAERQLAAARAAHAKLEQRLTAAEPEIARLRAELAEAGDELDRLRTAAKAPRDDAEVAQLRAELAEAGDELDRASADLVAANDDRARLRAELAAARDEIAAPREDVVGEEHARLSRELEGAWAERDRLAGDMAGVLGDRDQLAAEVAAARAGRERVEAELVAVRADRKRLERELGSLRSEREREPRPAARRPIRAAADSRLAPPQSGTALWAVRGVALGLVAILLAAIALAVAGVL